MDVSTILTNKGYLSTAIDPNPNRRLVIANFLGYAEPEDILQRFGEGKSEVESGLLLEMDQEALHDCQGQGSGTVNILGQTQSSFKAHLVLEKNSWVLWSQTWYPGWNLFLDGEKSGPVLRGNYTFMVACIPAGDHLVEFRYQPLSFRLGAMITLSSLGLIVAAAVLKKRTGKGLRLI
jgi:hypothetical protein